MNSLQNVVNQTLSLNLGTYRASAYPDVAGYTLLNEAKASVMQLYDHFLTIGTEIDVIWPTPWSVGKVLFYATKYPALLDGAFLLYSTTPSTSMMVVGMALAEFVLVFRTWAVWGKNSTVGISLLCAAFILACPTGYFTYYGFSQIKFGPSPRDVNEVCWVVTPPGNIIFLDYLLVVVFETIILILTTLKCFQPFRRSRSRLIVTLYRDGILYYVYLTGISIINMIILVTKLEHKPSLVFTQRVFHAIFTARILVNLRKAARSNCTNTDTLTTTDNTDRDRTIFSSILDVDTWFENPNSTRQMTQALPDGESGCETTKMFPMALGWKNNKATNT
ncbi:hypothetical protein BU17DRAFT_60257 [Hysterangium stoloniferum]|nr:hypothetical protein BU17DRAFT_60257 [Hysterangium stoloniferum]